MNYEEYLIQENKIYNRNMFRVVLGGIITAVILSIIIGSCCNSCNMEDRNLRKHRSITNPKPPIYPYHIFFRKVKL